MSTQNAVKPANVNASIGERVHQLIWRRRLPQATLALTLGISASTMSKKLRGERPWYPEELIAAANTLDVTVGYLFGEANDGGVGPAGIEPTTSTVETRRLAPVTVLRPRSSYARAARGHVA